MRLDSHVLAVLFLQTHEPEIVTEDQVRSECVRISEYRAAVYTHTLCLNLLAFLFSFLLRSMK